MKLEAVLGTWDRHMVNMAAPYTRLFLLTSLTILDHAFKGSVVKMGGGRHLESYRKYMSLTPGPRPPSI